MRKVGDSPSPISFYEVANMYALITGKRNDRVITLYGRGPNGQKQHRTIRLVKDGQRLGNVDVRKELVKAATLLARVRK